MCTYLQYSFPPRMARVLKLGLLFVIGGCGSPDSPVDPSVQPEAAQVSGDVAQQPGAPTELIEKSDAVLGRTEMALHELDAEEELGFAGLYYDASGNLVLRTTRPERGAGLRERVAAFRGGVLLRARNGRRTPGRIVIEAAEHSFRELAAWRNLIREQAWQPAMTQLDLDEAASRLSIGLESITQRSVTEEALVALGIPASALHFHETAPVQLQGDLDSKFRPVPGGVRIQPTPTDACTLTASVQTSTGLRGFLTASHCAGVDNMGSFSGQEFDQPDVPGNTIGAEWADPPFVGSIGAMDVTF